ncbi:MAG: arabinofuranosyltransferase [candidate division Zixibacteria bacterium]|nr:arabinofuranosyltransferase [candidate division Zixibacteria bacterium]
MNLIRPPKQYVALTAIILVFLIFAICLADMSLSRKTFTEDVLIRDCIWLDFWALLFYFAIVLIWCSSVSWRVKSSLCIICLSLWGFVAVALMFDGTPFSINGFAGDQKLRLAMVMKYYAFGFFSDMYYKDLPSFYPPIYYFLLSLYSRLFSVETFKMLKVGNLIMFLLGPAVLYYLWRKIVSPMQAFLITLFTFLFCSSGKVLTLVSPHAFVGNAIFIPWWLLFIERVKKPGADWRFYTVGGIIGGMLFMTYYYGFFIGGLLVLLRLTVLSKWRYVEGLGHFRFKAAVGVLAVSALVSAPYWLPLLIAAVIHGYDPAQQRWHHLGSTGILFKYQEFSLAGLLFLAAILYALRRARTALNRGLLLIAGTCTVFYLVGSLLGALDRPVNLIKANEFILVIAGPFIGLALAGALRWARLRQKIRLAVPIAVSFLLVFFIHSFNSFAKTDLVRTARTARAPTWGLDATEMESRKGRVFLTMHEELCSFYPVYSFMAHNEHYSNPASRFRDRFRFLYVLQSVHDPFLLNLALRHNVFDAVDYLMPRLQDGRFEIIIALSNYPDKHRRHSLTFETRSVDDTAMFVKETGAHLYRVEETPMELYGGPVFDEGTLRDSLLYLARLKMLREYLDSDGRVIVNDYIAACRGSWQEASPDVLPYDLDRSLQLRQSYLVSTADSIYFLFGLEGRQDFHADYRVYLHVSTGGEKEVHHNFDFAPPSATSTWRKGDIIWCCRAIPNLQSDFNFGFGLFATDGVMGRGFKGHYFTSKK